MSASIQEAVDAVQEFMPAIVSEDEYQRALGTLDWFIGEVQGNEEHPMTPYLQALSELLWTYIQTHQRTESTP